MTVLLAVAGAHAALYTQTFSPGTAVPDGSPVGIADSETFNMDPNSGDTVGALTLNLNITGGYDANLYAYVVAPNGTMTVLLNQPGVTPGTPFGNPGSGMNITFSDGGPAITASSDLSGGTYAAAGSLSGLDGSAADGTWTLFLADLTSGGGTSVLNSWTLNITAAPEPTSLAIFLVATLSCLAVRCRRFKKPA